MTTNNPLLAKGWKPSPLMVRILTAFVFLGVVIGLVLAGIYGVYLLVLILGGLALYEFNGLSDLMGSRAPAWLLYPLGIFFAFSGTVLKEVDVTLVLALALVGGLGAFLFLPGRRQGLSRWAMDLAGRQMSRLAQVKDSSHLIPGRGGVLDRLDSILFPPILVYLYVMVFHLL